MLAAKTRIYFILPASFYPMPFLAIHHIDIPSYASPVDNPTLDVVSSLSESCAGILKRDQTRLMTNL